MSFEKYSSAQEKQKTPEKKERLFDMITRFFGYEVSFKVERGEEKIHGELNRITKKAEIVISPEGIKAACDFFKKPEVRDGFSKFFAGTDEAPGMIVMNDGKRYKKYIGSASYESNHLRSEHQSGKKVKERLDVFVEGVSSLVDYKGAVSEVIRGILKGVQSGISYCGARNISEMQKNAEFIQITSAGWMESQSRGQKTQE